MSVLEPPNKKAKLEFDSLVLQNFDNYIQNIRRSSKPLKIIIADDIFSPLPLTNVYVGHIKESSLISKTILILNEKIPIKVLQHLKRVKGRDVLLCPVHYLNGTLSIQEYLEQNVPDLNNVFEYFKEITVPLLPPKVSTQYREVNKMWSINFHPDRYLERIINNTLFDNAELNRHRELMALTFEIAKWYIWKNEIQSGSDAINDINVAIVVDPVISSVVAIAMDNRLEHPMQHAAMLAIDNVAKSQDAGAWISEEEKQQSDRKHSGIDKELLSYLSETYTSMKFGARPFVKRKSESDDMAVSDGPYLCTGYYIYLMREPCIMCSMGLIHSRINRTFYCYHNIDHGAIQSRTMLHLNPSLNHRFEAFTGFLM